MKRTDSLGSNKEGGGNKLFFFLVGNFLPLCVQLDYENGFLLFVGSQIEVCGVGLVLNVICKPLGLLSRRVSSQGADTPW